MAMSYIIWALKRQQSLNLHVICVICLCKQCSYSVNFDIQLELSSPFFQTCYWILEHLALHSLVCKLKSVKWDWFIVSWKTHKNVSFYVKAFSCKARQCHPGLQYLLIDDVYVSGFKNFLTGIQLKLWCCDTALLLLNWTLYLMSLEQNSSRKLSLSPFHSFSLTVVSYTVPCPCCRNGACSTSEAANRLWAIEKSKCSHTLLYFLNLFSNFCFRFPNLSLETLPLDDVRPLTNWPLSVMTTEAAGPVWARELPVALFPFLDLPQVLCFLPLPHGIPTGWEMLVSLSSFCWRDGRKDPFPSDM